MAQKDLNKYIKKSHIKAVEKFNEELKAWSKETGEKDPTLYEDAFTSFTLANIELVNGYLCYDYDGKPEKDMIVRWDGEEYWEDDIEGIMETVKFWRKCLNRAKKYWAMDPDRLDAIQDGEAEDINDEEEK